MRCPACGFEGPPDARFCASCGTPLAGASPAREERKVVSVLFCDLAGFTSRAERLDPEDVRSLLGRYHSRVRGELEHHGGTVEKFIGDAVVALFGAPAAHEDDPERAVRAALAIRDSIADENETAGQDLQIRIGITTGEAVVALDARPASGEGLASGDVVNTCARLQAAAPVGGILVDETTFRATERAIEYRAAEPVIAKGKEQPVSAWEVVAARSRFGVDVVQRGQAPLVGRDEELALLTGALARARGERAPQLVTLVGVPGIGKSRLVWELFQTVDADPELIWWRQGRSLPYGDGVTYWALGEMVKAQAGILETDRADAAAEKLHGIVARLVEGDADARWIEGHLRPLVGLASGSEFGGERRGEAFAAWRRFFEALADEGPTVLVFEDLHWADDDLLDFADYLVEWASGVPLLVVGTARPELLDRRPGWGGGKRNALTVSLSALTDEETARLVASLLDRSVLDAGVQSLLLARAGGNPLYAEEYVHMLRERGDVAELALPETLQGIIAARLDTLPAPDKTLLQDAAVIGKVFWVGALAEISDVPRWQVDERLHALERLEFVRRDRRSSVASETEFVFRHALVRDVAYSQIPRARRGQSHRRIAAWIESLGRPDDHAEMLAHHYVAALELARATGEDPGDLATRVCAVLTDAGDRALALSAYTAAMRSYGAAAELAEPESLERARLLLAAGRAEHMGDQSLGEPGLLEAIDALTPHGAVEDLAEAHLRLADVAWRAGNQSRMFAHLDKGVALVKDAPPSPQKAYVTAEAARMLMLAARHAEAVALGRDAFAMARELGLDELAADSLNTIGTARVLLGDVGGIEDVERSVALVQAGGYGQALVRAAVNSAALAGYLGEVRRYHEYVEMAHAAAVEIGNAEGVRWTRSERAASAYSLGHWDEAEAMATRSWPSSGRGSAIIRTRRFASVAPRSGSRAVISRGPASMPRGSSSSLAARRIPSCCSRRSRPRLASSWARASPRPPGR
ncbi:MAG: adenylate/guanylate cyclase domain-containing protein [Gaiellales bacterium]